jgi:hypothetical protein
MYYELRKRGTTAHAPLQEGCTQGRQLGLGSESPCCAGQAEMIRTKREHDHVCGWRNVKVVPVWMDRATPLRDQARGLGWGQLQRQRSCRQIWISPDNSI